MNVGVFLNYIGLGSNILHLSYCHEIAKRYGPITIITLCKNLDQALGDDPNIKEIIIDQNLTASLFKRGQIPTRKKKTKKVIPKLLFELILI